MIGWIPQRWKRRDPRMDHSKFYMCMMWALFTGTLFILLRGPVHPSVLDGMADSVQRLYALVLCLGTGCCITGFLSGTRVLRPNADLRSCYRLAIYATPANVTTLSLYIVGIGNSLHWTRPFLFIESTCSVFAIIVAHLLMAWDLHWEVGRINERLRAAVVKAIADSGHHDAD